MPQNHFVTGDLVRLKSGGPVMTVNNADHREAIECQWFGGKKLARGFFPLDSLEAAEKDEK